MSDDDKYLKNFSQFQTFHFLKDVNVSYGANMDLDQYIRLNKK